MASRLLAAVEAAKAYRAQQAGAAAVALQRKSVIQVGPIMSRGVSGRPVRDDWSTERAIDRYFKASPLVYRPAMSLATMVGSIRWQVEVLDGGKWRGDESHDLQALLDKPHAFFTRQLWNEVLVLYLTLAGKAMFQKTTASGRMLPGATKPRLLELTPLLPIGINPVADQQQWIARYEFQGPPKKIWQVDEILRYILPDPGNLLSGMSPLQAAASVIQMDLKAVEWNLNSLDNRAIADGVFTSDHPLTATQYEDLKDQIWEQHQGAVHAHEPWVLGAGKWQEMSRSPVEMDFNETRMRTREEILSSLYVSPVSAGYFENATLANAEISRRMTWEDGVIPTFVERIVGGLNADVVPHFGAPGKLRVTYDISSVPALRDDLIKKAQALKLLVSSGTPYNQAIAELEMDLDPIPGVGDEPYGLENLKTPRVFGGPPPEPKPTADPGGAGDGAGATDLQDDREKRARRPQGRKLNTTIKPTIFALEVADAQAPSIRRAFLAEIAKLKLGTDQAGLASAVRSGDAAAALQRLGAMKLSPALLQSLGAAIERTAREGGEAAAEQLASQIGEAFSLDQGRVKRWAVPYLDGRIGQLSTTTEEAVRAFFVDLAEGKLGKDADVAAQLLKETFGLHKQQAAGVRDVFRAALARGQDPVKAVEAATKLARQRLNERAKLIATQESLVAANRGNGIAWEQAIDEGKVSEVIATWYTEENENVCDECASLSDQEVNIAAGERFQGASGATYREPPGPHPECLCGVLYSAVR